MDLRVAPVYLGLLRRHNVWLCSARPRRWIHGAGRWRDEIPQTDEILMPQRDECYTPKTWWRGRLAIMFNMWQLGSIRETVR